MALKQLSQWQDSQKKFEKFDDFVQVGDDVDEAMADYFFNILPPMMHGNGSFQVPEASSTVEGRNTYPTFMRSGSAWRYMGDCHYGKITPPAVAA